MAAKEAPLVSVSPTEILQFQLERNVTSRTTLHITNVSTHKVIFKVKTTQPSWYYVRPNQQIVDVGQTEEVSIVLIESESNRYLDQFGTDKVDKLDKHRFLVQSKVISDEDFVKIKEIPIQSRGDEYIRLWEGAVKDESKNIKLRVEFQCPHVAAQSSSLGGDSAAGIAAERQPFAVVGESADSLRSRLSRSNTGPAAPSSSGAATATAANSSGGDNTTTSSSIQQAGSSSSSSQQSHFDTGGGGGGGAGGGGMSHSVALIELENLKKKYDAVVEYTVHLTAERDTIMVQLEEVQRDLTRELTRSKRAGTDGGSRGAGDAGKDKTDKRLQKGGFTFMMVLIFVLIAFCAGKYLPL